MKTKLISAVFALLLPAALFAGETHPYVSGVSVPVDWYGATFVRYPAFNIDAPYALSINSGTALGGTNQAAHQIASIWNQGGGTETCSSGGCEIGFVIGTTTFATAGSTIRCGLQDQAASGMPAHGDGTFDVYDDLVQGTDSMAAGAKTVTMSSGSKSVANGDLVAVVCNFTTRNGADSVQFAGSTRNSGNDAANLPVYVYENPAGTYTSQQTGVNFWVKYDSGRYGFPIGAVFATQGLTQNYNNGSSPSRYGNIIKVPVPAKACGFSFNGSLLAAGRTADVILNEEQADGTFTAIPGATVSLVADNTSSASNRTISHGFPSCVYLTAEKRYFLEIVPTTANNIAVTYIVTASNAQLGGTLCGANCYRGVRSSSSAAPTTDTNYLMSLSLLLGGFQSGICRGGGSEPC